MFQYNPTVNDISGQILGQGLERQGDSDAQAIQARAEADLAAALRKANRIKEAVGLGVDVVKLAASIYTGGAAGAAMSMAGGGMGGGGGGGEGAGGGIGSLVNMFANRKAADAKDKAYTGFFQQHGEDLGFDAGYLQQLKDMPRDERVASFDLMTGQPGQRLGSLSYLNQQASSFGARPGGTGAGGGAFFTMPGQ